MHMKLMIAMMFYMSTIIAVDQQSTTKMVKNWEREREREREKRESLFTKYIYITHTYQLLQWQAASEGISPS